MTRLDTATLTIDLRQVICAISDALDLVGVDDFYHGKRVATMALACAQTLGWSEASQLMLFDAALLHDCGVSSTRLHTQLVDEMDWAGAQQHCQIGAVSLQETEALAYLAPVVQYHHTHWEDLNTMSLPVMTQQMANLIFLVDRADTLACPYYPTQTALLHREAICTRLGQYVGRLFSPELFAAFNRASDSEAFWLRLEPRHLADLISDMGQYAAPRTLSLASFHQLANVFARLVDAKSPYTATHSIGVAKVSRFLAEHYGFSEPHCEAIEIAALLHDLGKLRIPDEVLEKPAALSDSERLMMARHSFETYAILRRIQGLEDIALWAGLHHENPDGVGYPFRLRAPDIPLEARLIRMADIYQALAQKRPYRKPLRPSIILERLAHIITPDSFEHSLWKIIARYLNIVHSLAICAEEENISQNTAETEIR